MRTEHLEIKGLEPQDASVVFSLTSNPEVARYMRFSTHQTLQEARELLEAYAAPGNAAFLYSEAKARRPVGVFAFKRAEGEEDVYDLSIFSEPDSWNKGYATELMEVFIPYARDTLGAKQLKAYVVSQNLGSRRVLEKAGFVPLELLVFDDLPQGLYVYSLEL